MHERAGPVGEFVPAHDEPRGLAPPEALPAELALEGLPPAPPGLPHKVVVQESHFVSSIVFFNLDLSYFLDSLSLHSPKNVILRLLVGGLRVEVVLGVAVPLGEVLGQGLQVQVGLHDAPDGLVVEEGHFPLVVVEVLGELSNSDRLKRDKSPKAISFSGSCPGRWLFTSKLLKMYRQAVT